MTCLIVTKPRLVATARCLSFMFQAIALDYFSGGSELLVQALLFPIFFSFDLMAFDGESSLSSN